MKIRNGFVSNSSSSSFIIYGASFDTYDTEIEQLIKTHLTVEQKEELVAGDDTLEYLLPKLGLEIYEDYEMGEIFFGKSWSKVGDEETGKQFKDSVDEKLKEIFGKPIKSDTIQTVIEG